MGNPSFPGIKSREELREYSFLRFSVPYGNVSALSFQIGNCGFIEDTCGFFQAGSRPAFLSPPKSLLLNCKKMLHKKE